MRAALAMSILVLCACGSGTNGPSDAGFAGGAGLSGNWNGTTTEVSGTQSASAAATLVVSNPTPNVIGLSLCPDGSKVNATLTSNTAFNLVVPVNCPAALVSNCPSTILALTSGSGTVSGPAAGLPDGGASGTTGSSTITLTTAGTLTGCNSSFGVSISFTGTKN
jgi:hypothetical protein